MGSIAEFLKELRTLDIQQVEWVVPVGQAANGSVVAERRQLLDLSHYTKPGGVKGTPYRQRLLTMMRDTYDELAVLSRIDMQKIKVGINELNTVSTRLIDERLTECPEKAAGSRLGEKLVWFEGSFNSRIERTPNFFYDLYQILMDKQNAAHGFYAALNQIYVNGPESGTDDWGAAEWILHTYFVKAAIGVAINDSHINALSEHTTITRQTISNVYKRFATRSFDIPDNTNARNAYSQALRRIIPSLSGEALRLAQLQESRMK